MNEELKHHEKAPLVCGILGGGGAGVVVRWVGGKMWEDAECCFFSR